MKKFLTILSLVALLTCSATFQASAKDSQPKEATAVFTVNPPMSCQNCENKIKSNLRFEKGVKSITTSLENQTVTVVYKPKDTNPDKLAQALAKIGYEACDAPQVCTIGLKEGSCCKADSTCQKK